MKRYKNKRGMRELDDGHVMRTISGEEYYTRK